MQGGKDAFHLAVAGSICPRGPGWVFCVWGHGVQRQNRETEMRMNWVATAGWYGDVLESGISPGPLKCTIRRPADTVCQGNQRGAQQGARTYLSRQSGLAAWRAGRPRAAAAALSGNFRLCVGTRSSRFIIRKVFKLILNLVSHITIFKSQLIGKLQ